MASTEIRLRFFNDDDAHDCADWLDTIDDGAARDIADTIRGQIPPRQEPEEGDW
jgi:hypothetical protein